MIRADWEALVDAHGPAVLAAFRTMAPREAEDLFQEFWARLMEDGGRRMKGVDPERPLRPWLIAVALNLARRRMSKARPEPLLAEPESPSVEDKREDLALALKALEGLSPRDRLLIELAGVEGRSPEEVGALLGVAPQSVRGLLSRARERLKSANPCFKEGARG